MVDEKGEKEMQKREEKSPEEKSWDEKWSRDPLGTLVWAILFIWAGLVFLADNLDMLDGLRSWEPLSDMGPWSLVLIGAGVIILLEVLVRLVVPEYRRSVIGSLIFAVILLGIGLGDAFDWNIIWALILIVLGVSIIFRGVSRSG